MLATSKVVKSVKQLRFLKRTPLRDWPCVDLLKHAAHGLAWDLGLNSVPNRKASRHCRRQKDPFTPPEAVLRFRV